MHGRNLAAEFPSRPPFFLFPLRFSKIFSCLARALRLDFQAASGESPSKPLLISQEKPRAENEVVQYRGTGSCEILEVLTQPPAKFDSLKWRGGCVLGASFVRPRERESLSQKEARRHSLQKEGFFFQSSNGMKMMSQNPKS